MAGRKGKKTIFKYIQKDPPPGDSEGLWLDTNWNVVRKWIPLDDDDPNNTGLWRSFGERYGKGSDYGYICGGYDGSNRLSTIDRITFPFDSGTAKNVGNLSGSRLTMNNNNSSTHGYIYGGEDEINEVSTIDRITFPFNDGTSNNVGNLSGSRRAISANNSSSHGYICGGYDGNDDLSIIDRITFPFDSGTSNNVGNLTRGAYGFSGCNSSTFGYTFGGRRIGDDSIAKTTIIERFKFPFDSGVSSNVGNLSYDNNTNNTANNSSSHGYICGGYDGTSGGSYESTIARITFPFDSGTANNVGNLSGSINNLSANNSSTYGYICGGYDKSNRLSIIDRITFPFDDGTANNVGNLSGTKSSSSATDGTDFVTQFPAI